MNQTDYLAKFSVKFHLPPPHGNVRASPFSLIRWFTEGFDTAELMEAKALLEELK